MTGEFRVVNIRNHKYHFVPKILQQHMITKQPTKLSTKICNKIFSGHSRVEMEL